MNTFKTIDEVRKDLEELLESVPEGQRITIPNSKNLDKLLFAEYVIDEAKGIKVKIPVWTGPFLSKLDLSEVDCTDVSWSINNELYENGLEELKEIINKINDNETKYDEFYDFASNDTEQLCWIDFSNTNIKIDFSKSFEYKNFKKIYIQAINLENVDLTNNDLFRKTLLIEASNLKNTGIKLKDVEDLEVVFVDLENVSLSRFSTRLFSDEFTVGDGIQRSYDPREDDYATYAFSLVCDSEGFIPSYKNTGLVITTDNKMEELFEDNHDLPFFINGIEIKNLHDYFYNSGLFDGCKIDGRIVQSGLMPASELLTGVEEQVSRIRKKED